MVIDNFLSYVEVILNVDIHFIYQIFDTQCFLDSNSIPQDKYGYHRDCCAKYTHKQQLERANKRKQQQEESKTSKSQILNAIALLITDPLDDHQVNISYTFADYFPQFMLVQHSLNCTDVCPCIDTCNNLLADDWNDDDNDSSDESDCRYEMDNESNFEDNLDDEISDNEEQDVT